MLSMALIKNDQIEDSITILKQIIPLLTNEISLAKIYADIGALFNKLEKIQEAKNYFKKSVELDKENHSNYFNLGVIYALEKNFSKAIDNYKEAEKKDPNNHLLYNNLAQALAHSSKTLQEALDCQKKSLNLSPDNEDLIFNLGTILYLNGCFEEAIIQYQKSVKLNPQKWKSWEKLLDLLFFIKDTKTFDDIIKTLTNFRPNIPTNIEKKIYFYLTLLSFSKFDYEECQLLLNDSSYLYKIEDEDKKMKWAKTYNIYIQTLLSYYKNNRSLYNNSYEDIIYAVGESHCLSPAHVVVSLNNKNYKIEPRIIIGCKIWHLISEYDFQYKKMFNLILKDIPNNSIVLFCLGEIDCRIDEGIMSFYKKNPEIKLDEYISKMIIKYISFLENEAKSKNIEIIIQGIPAPYIDFSNNTLEEKEAFLSIVKKMNLSLQEQCSVNNIKYLDVYNLTVNAQGTSNTEYHIDNYHLKPCYLASLL
jgi:tetratricopeptide (TPR) repeat protein